VNGNNYLLDTNILLYALKGLTDVRLYFDIPPAISVVTEIEILGVKEITEEEIKIRETVIEYCHIIPLTGSIKKKTIDLKKEIKLAIPDAIIAAASIERNFTLVTADKGFKRIKRLSLILIEV
jgi:predicted nucleic acid-binding protein